MQTILSKELPDVLTKKEVAYYLRVSTQSIVRHEEAGDFTHFTRGEKETRLYRKSDIESYLQSIN